MHGKLFYGCATALVTPFRGGKVDFDALQALIDWQIEEGVDALVLLGTTGEPACVSEPERRAILECAAARIAGRVPLIAGAGSNDTRTAIRHCMEAQRIGADALLVVTPYYNRTSRTGLIAHYTAIADSVRLPIIMYNVPGRTGMNLPPEVVAELAKHPNLCAVKEASGSLSQLTDMAAVCGGGLALYSGNDDQVLPAMALGARGVISVAANLIPATMHEMAAGWLRGDPDRCRELQLEYLPLLRMLFSEVNPIPVKAALSMMGRAENELRLPLVPLDEDRSGALLQMLMRFGLVG